MNKSYYAVIPAGVRYDNDLTANAKLMYGEITALSNEKGFCYASNKYFAMLYKVDSRTIQRWIQQLKDKKYISVKNKYENGILVERRIGVTKMSSPHDNNVISPTTKMSPYNNIYYNNNNSNNIINNNNNSVKSKIKDFSELVNSSFEPICNLFPEKARPKTNAQKNSWLDTIDKLDRLDGYNPRKVYFICKKVREDSFWKDNFLSILKLRKNDNSGVKYIVKFEQRFAKDLQDLGL